MSKSTNWRCTVRGTDAEGTEWSWIGACTAPTPASARTMATTLALQAAEGGRVDVDVVGPHRVHHVEVEEYE
jgi:hypothetical protein